MKKIFLSLLTILLVVSTCNTLIAGPLKVGILIPLSGPIAVYGESIRNGIEMFRKEKPDTKIEFLYDDSKYEAQTSISGFNNLIASKEVDLIFCWGSTPASVLAPIAEFRKFPLILLTG